MRALDARAIEEATDACVEACARIIASAINAGSEREAIMEDERFASMIRQYITREWSNPYA